MSSCLFCTLANTDRRFSDDAVEDTIIAESPNFYVKPALGQFIEGYVLIMPKDHYRTFGEIPSDSLLEFAELAKETRQKISEIYGKPTIMFEHGAVCPQNRVGSCIDHAHIHIVPFDGNIDISELDGSIRPVVSFQDLVTVSAEGSYVFLADGNGSRCVLPKASLRSQYMRKRLAAEAGLSDVWDWRKYPYREVIKSCIDRFIEQPVG